MWSLLIFSLLTARDISGCTDPVALNYNPQATLEDFSCEYDINQWTVTPSDFQYDGAVIGAVFVNGSRTTNTSDLLAVFAGTECRGLAYGLEIPGSQEVVFMVMLYSNTSSGEILTFRYLDAGNGIVSIPAETLEFSPNMIVGSVLDPLAVTVSELGFDCAGIYGGNAEYDSCGICSGGTTGIIPNSEMDFCGVCFGDNSCPGNGDLNNDGSLDILDAVRLVSIIMGEVQGDGYEIWSGDTNGDGALDVLDVIVIMTAIMGNS
ncbi:MAG: hypothetical protein GXO91_06040 [FCB group bacterium]|nr:hypothetical protein [FCB group bacterium]